MILLRRHCQPLTLDEDHALLSKAGHLETQDDGGQRLWWGLDFLYDKLKSHGENRKLYAWVQFFKQKVSVSELCPEEFFCQTKQSSLPQHALHENVATTASILAFLFGFCLKDSRTSATVKFVSDWVPSLCSRVCSMLSCTVSIEIEGMMSLMLSPAGLVRGLENTLSALHRTCFTAWEKEWQAMCDAGILTDALVGEADSSVSLQELVRFMFGVDRRKRKVGGHIWQRNSTSGSALFKMQRGIVMFLANGLDLYVREHCMQCHNTSKALPSRRIRPTHASADGPSGQRTPQSSTMVKMSPDSIWDLFARARDCGVSMKGALQLFDSDRVSAIAGCKPTSVDPWVRRSQTLYDRRASMSLLGATHFNLVADCSTHSSKEILVSVCFSHQNDTACFANIQKIPALTQVAPGEMDLTELVTRLAQDWFQIKLNCLSWFPVGIFQAG